MESSEDWSTDANEALEISLVKRSATGDIRPIAETFHPKFTYPIFGRDEQIFGYKDLTIHLRFHAADMRPNLYISFGRKFRSIGGTAPADIEGLLESFLPEVAFQRSKLFDLAVESAPVDWAPPGELVKSYQASDGTYEIWKGSLADPAVKQLVNRIQVLVPLFIEGGTFIGTHVSDGLARWTVFFLYRKTNAPGPGITPYEFAGYSTVYRFFYFKKPTERRLLTAADFKLPFESFTVVEEPARTRISQFIILPPFQHKGNAGQLYSTIFQHYLDSPEVVEITVEDPNEAFDDLRDLTDRSYLLGIPEFHSIKIDTSVVFEPGRASKNPVDEAAVEELRLKTKIAPRQFHRLVEMQLMSRLPVSVRPRIEDEPRVAATDAEKHEYRLWKGLVKQRLYRRNKEILGQLDREERIQKLDETLGAVEMEYARLLAAAADRAKHGEQTAKPKRGLEANSSEPTSKKARLDTQ